MCLWNGTPRPITTLLIPLNLQLMNVAVSGVITFSITLSINSSSCTCLLSALINSTSSYFIKFLVYSSNKLSFCRPRTYVQSLKIFNCLRSCKNSIRSPKLIVLTFYNELDLSLCLNKLWKLLIFWIHVTLVLIPTTSLMVL